MARLFGGAYLVLYSALLWAYAPQGPAHPSFDYETARKHELGPQRHVISVVGVTPGFNQLRLTLTVSPAGEVIAAEASGDEATMSFWPQVEHEVREWKFSPFEQNGKAVTAIIEDYVDLVPPQRLPKRKVRPPQVKPTSRVIIALERSGCFGTCPGYVVSVSTEGIVFNGGGYVVARGRHTESADPDEVRALAKRFVAADFYSMDARYAANVTDNPTYILSISIDGRQKEVEDYVGRWEGMPAVITELQDAVDGFARTERWIEGTEGLVDSLRAENFDFQSFGAQVMLKEAASRGKTATVREMLASSVPLEPLPAPQPDKPWIAVPFEHVGWLTAASSHPDTLQTLLQAGASQADQEDKDRALAMAARSGSVEAVQLLIGYGANPNADLSNQVVSESSAGMTISGRGAGSVLIYAASSGNPDLIRELLRYRPDLDKRDQNGETALFAAGRWAHRDKDGARVECVRLLVEAGADVNARDKDGNTPLHKLWLTDVEEELLRLGADVNARNNDGETPIFTTIDDEAIPLFIRHGADLSIRNNQGETVLEAAERHGSRRQAVLQNAILGLQAGQKQ